MSASVVHKVGPFGTQRQASPKQYYDDQYTGIRQIKLVYTDMINSMTTEYDNNGVSVWGTERGTVYTKNTTKIKTVSINLSPEDEFLISVSGHYADWKGYIVIYSLKLQTNKREFGPFGTETGTQFSFPPSSGKIVGFFGRSGGRLDSIGGYWVPIPISLASSLSTYKADAAGGKGGRAWDDGTHTTVQKIQIWYGDIIDGISFTYGNEGDSVLSQVHGTNQAVKSYTVELGHPSEYLVSVSGFVRNESSPNVIRSLTFVTNKKAYGPFGCSQTGRKFLFSPDEGKIIGFYGKSGSGLDSIGVYRESVTVEPERSLGGGTQWDDGTHAKITKIEIWTDNFVESLKIQYATSDGKLTSSEKHGSSTFGDKDEFEITATDEYLTSVTGYYDTFTGWSTPIIVSLTFKTNRRTFGPYGPESGTMFQLRVGNSKIVGFHGRSGQFLDSIGAHVLSSSGK